MLTGEKLHRHISRFLHVLVRFDLISFNLQEMILKSQLCYLNVQLY